MICIPRTARYVVRNQSETAEDTESTSEHQRIQQYGFSGFSLILSCLTVSFSCGIVYSRGKRTPESEKKQVSVYIIKRKIKKKMLVYVPGTYISPFVVALEGGVNSNPSSREVILEDGKSETGPKQLRTWLTRSVLPHTGDQARSVE